MGVLRVTVPRGVRTVTRSVTCCGARGAYRKRRVTPARPCWSARTRTVARPSTTVVVTRRTISVHPVGCHWDVLR